MNKELTPKAEPVSVGRKVMNLAKQLGLKVPELAEYLGVSRSTPYSYTNRKKTANPTYASIDLLIERLIEERGVQVPRGWFFDGQAGDAPVQGGDVKFVRPTEVHNPAASGIAAGDLVLLPLWRGVLASEDGECIFDEGDSPESLAIPAFITGGESEKHVVGVASGVSMYPRLGPGELIVIKIDPSPPRNSIIVARKEGLGNFVKAYRVVDGREELHSLNETFPKIIGTRDWTKRGYAVAIIKGYEGEGPNIEWDFGRPLKA